MLTEESSTNSVENVSVHLSDAKHSSVKQKSLAILFEFLRYVKTGYGKSPRPQPLFTLKFRSSDTKTPTAGAGIKPAKNVMGHV